VELSQLQAFATIAALGHLTRAAEQLHISQPALSGRIRSLEDELGVALFDRTPAGMTLTSAGRELLPLAERALDAARELRTRASSLHELVRGRLRIGTISDPEFIRLGPFLGELRARHPLIEIELHQEVSGKAFDAVLEGALDASFYFGDRDHPDLFALPLRRYRYLVAGPAAWRDQLAHSSWSDLATMPWVLTPPVSTHHTLIRTLFGDLPGKPDKTVEADNESVLVSLVTAGIGLSLVREDIARDKQQEGELAVHPSRGVQTVLLFIHRRERAAEPCIRAVLAALREVWQLGPSVQGDKSAR
jgi:DNA-binding transcriptional LysR family regulator